MTIDQHYRAVRTGYHPPGIANSSKFANTTPASPWNAHQTIINPANRPPAKCLFLNKRNFLVMQIMQRRCWRDSVDLDPANPTTFSLPCRYFEKMEYGVSSRGNSC